MSDQANQSAQATTNADQSANASAETIAANTLYPEGKAAEASAEVQAETKLTQDASAVPQTYDLKLPDGSTLEQSHLEKIASFSKERGFSNEQAQALLERDHQTAVQFAEANKPGGADWSKRVSEWESQALVDKEIGGSKDALKQSAELGGRVLNKFFPETVRKFLVDSGFGSHPDVIRGFSKLGKMMADDQLVREGSGSSNKKSMAEIFYPSKEGA
jgi:hypothetical protein